MKIVCLAALIAMTAALASISAAGAQTEIDVRDSRAESAFPNGIVFTLDAASDVEFDDIRLVYQIAPDGVRTSAIPTCSGGAVVNCTFDLGASRRNVIIPGAEVTFFWRLESGGVNLDTPSQLVEYEDSRFEWRELTESNVTISWYDGSEDEAREVLNAGRETLDTIGALIQTIVDFPVKIRYYGSARDMQAAIISDNDEGVVTLGEVVYSDTAMVAADSSPLDITRHEITHIVVRAAVNRALGVPDWLNEGLAVFAQSGPLQGQSRAVEQAIQSGQVLSVRSLSSASSGALSDRVSLFYGQSWSLVSFLVETHGSEQFAALFRAFDEGASDDEALMQVYGFDQDGLENAWRSSVGLPPRATAEPTDSASVVETEAAPAPEASGAADDGDGVSIGLLVGIAIATVLLLVGLGGAAVVLARRYG